MESREFLRTWNQSTWPEDDFTVEANREDMVKMEQRHVDGEAFGYTMVTPIRPNVWAAFTSFHPMPNGSRAQTSPLSMWIGGRRAMPWSSSG